MNKKPKKRPKRPEIEIISDEKNGDEQFLLFDYYKCLVRQRIQASLVRRGSPLVNIHCPMPIKYISLFTRKLTRRKVKRRGYIYIVSEENENSSEVAELFGPLWCKRQVNKIGDYFMVNLKTFSLEFKLIRLAKNYDSQLSDDYQSKTRLSLTKLVIKFVKVPGSQQVSQNVDD